MSALTTTGTSTRSSPPGWLIPAQILTAAVAIQWLAAAVGPGLLVVQIPWLVACLLRHRSPGAMLAGLAAAALCLVERQGGGEVLTFSGAHGWTALALALTPLPFLLFADRLPATPPPPSPAPEDFERADERKVAVQPPTSSPDRRVAIDALPQPLLAANAQGRIVALNVAWQASHGHAMAQVRGCPIADLLMPEARGWLGETLSALTQNCPPPSPLDAQLRLPSGALRKVRVEIGFGLVPPEDTAGVWFVMREIAPVEVRERDIAFTEARYRSLVEDQSDLVSLADQQGVLIFVNRAYARHFGHTPDAMIGSNLFDYVSEHDRPAVRRHLEMVVHSGRIITDQNRMLSADGVLHWVEWTNRALPDSGGVQRLIHSVGRDITERKQAEQAMRLLMQEQSAIINSELIGITKVRDRRYSWGNVGVCRMLGYTLEELVGMPTLTTYPDAEAHRALGTAAYPVIRGGGTYRGETPMRRKDGREIWVEATAVMFDRDTDEALWLFTDVTIRKEAELALRRNLALTEQQRGQLAELRDEAESEASLARFLLSRLARIAQLDAAGVAYHWVPAESFSGDLIAVTTSGTGDRYGMLADATGHGLAAAINLIPLTLAFYDIAGKGFNLVTLSEQLNQVVKDYSLPDRFVAVTLVRFVTRERQLEIVNAGNPSALLLDGRQRTVREFDSGSVPLGILDRQNFRPRIEMHALTGAEQLLLFSDGVIEACDGANVAFGRRGLDDAIASAAVPGEVLPAIRTRLEGHMAGRRQQDDISLLLMDVPEVLAEAAQFAGPAPAQRATIEQAPQPRGRAGWTVNIALSSEELKRVEVVPVMVDLTRTLGLGPEPAARFFTVLSELVVNALEHGLLQMDSAIKASPDGFDRYLELREARLLAMSEGSIELRLTHSALADGGHLRIEVNDSGAGFDHRQKLAELASRASDAGDPRPSGRGLPLLLTLCERLEFNEIGNGVTAELSYH
jgi:PAS domain S-box-containing protein